MSKKDKLKAQKAKQDKTKRDLELLEQQEIQAAKSKISKSAEKMLNKSKKQKHKKLESGIMLFLKLLMIIPLVYSGVFYGGVTIIGIAKGEMHLMDGSMNPMPSWVAIAMGLGCLAIIAGIFLSFFKKYYISLAFILAGTISYMKSAIYIVHEISKKLETSSVSPDIADMDKDYMKYYYPIMAVLLIAVILAVIALVKKIRRKKRLKAERDNAPVKSIVDI